jgi:hypothetical protein
MYLFTRERKMLLDNHPFAVPFFKNTGPAGVLPVCRLAFPFIYVIKVTEEPGNIHIFRISQQCLNPFIFPGVT